MSHHFCFLATNVAPLLVGGGTPLKISHCIKLNVIKVVTIVLQEPTLDHNQNALFFNS